MTIRHIIFDWDGTLVRTLDLWLEGYRSAFSARGFQFCDQEIVAEFFTNHDKVPDRHPSLDFPNIAKQAFSYVKNNATNTSLYEGADRIATDIAQVGIDVTLVSSSGRNVLEQGLSTHGLADHFISSIAGDDGYGHKPQADPFKEMLERTGYGAGETLVIGDSFVDIQAGKALGSVTCHFAPEDNRTFYDFDDILKLEPDYQISRLHQLLDLV